MKRKKGYKGRKKEKREKNSVTRRKGQMAKTGRPNKYLP